MEPMRWAIVQQGRFEIAALLGVALITIGAGLLVLLLIKLGLPERPTVMIGTSVIALGLTAAGIYYFTGSQGVIESDGSALIAKPRLRTPISVSLPNASFERGTYRERTRGSAAYVVGPVLTVSDRFGGFSIGCHDAEIGRQFAAEDRHAIHVPPSFIVQCPHFVEIVEKLGLDLAHVPDDS